MTSVLKSALAALTIAVAAASTPAAAQAPGPMPPLPNPSPASVALAKEIMVSKQAGNFYAGAVTGIVGQVKDSVLRDNLDKQKDLNEVAIKVAQDLKGRENEVGDLMAKVYASQFTEQEMRDLSAFYKSPLGKKVIENEPKAMEQSLGYINEWTGKFQDEVMQRFKAEMKKRGKDI